MEVADVGWGVVGVDGEEDKTVAAVVAEVEWGHGMKWAVEDVVALALLLRLVVVVAEGS